MIRQLVDNAFETLSKKCDKLTEVFLEYDDYRQDYLLRIEGKDRVTNKKYGVMVSLCGIHELNPHNAKSTEEFITVHLNEKFAGLKRRVKISVSSIYARNY